MKILRHPIAVVAMSCVLAAGCGGSDGAGSAGAAGTPLGAPGPSASPGPSPVPADSLAVTNLVPAGSLPATLRIDAAGRTASNPSTVAGRLVSAVSLLGTDAGASGSVQFFAVTGEVYAVTLNWPVGAERAEARCFASGFVPPASGAATCNGAVVDLTTTSVRFSGTTLSGAQTLAGTPTAVTVTLGGTIDYQ